MPGFANERGLAPFFDDAAAPPGEGIGAVRPADGRAPPAAARPRRLGAARDMLDGIGGLGWSVIGFIGGAVFWHFIGFWGFVSEVVLAGRPPTLAEQARIHAAMTERPPHRVQIADASVPSCTLLSLDRRTGRTSARPCDGRHVALPADSFQGRQDRMVGSERGGQAPTVADDGANP